MRLDTVNIMVLAMVLRDRCGRVVNYLRISVTDRCNLRCYYCMPAHLPDPGFTTDILSFEDIVRTVQVANGLGIDRARITGGEPLVRKNLPRLIRLLKSETDLREVAMTTNGMLLAQFAEELAESGLDWINVSVDSFSPDRYRRITHTGVLETVWEGIERAVDAGLHPVKINTVILDGFNDDEVDEWVQLTMGRDLVVRFLELMPIGQAVHVKGFGGYANLTEIRERLTERYGLVPTRLERGNGPARYWKVPGAQGMLGFITPISDRYCDTCSRLRLTSCGEVRPCLAHDEHVSLREAIAVGDKQAIEDGFRTAARVKREGHHWELGQATNAAMSRLGG